MKRDGRMLILIRNPGARVCAAGTKVRISPLLLSEQDRVLIGFETFRDTAPWPVPAGPASCGEE